MSTAAVRLPAPIQAVQGEPTLGFGRYAEWPITHLPPHYLLWLLSHEWFKNQHPHAHHAVLDLALDHLIRERAARNGESRRE